MKRMNRFLMVSLLLLPGCATMDNIGKVNRLIPQMEILAMKQDQVNQEGGHADVTLTAKDAEECKLLLAIARNMGWTLKVQEGNCVVVTYHK